MKTHHIATRVKDKELERIDNLAMDYRRKYAENISRSGVVTKIMELAFQAGITAETLFSVNKANCRNRTGDLQFTKLLLKADSGEEKTKTVALQVKNRSSKKASNPPLNRDLKKVGGSP